MPCVSAENAVSVVLLTSSSHSAAPSSTQTNADDSNHPDEVLTQVGFGSCSRHNLDQSYWPYVTAALTTNEAPTLHQPLTPVSHCPSHGPSQQNSGKKIEKLTGQDRKKDTKGTAGKTGGDDGCVDGFVWLGDVIYGDTNPFYGIWYPSAYSVIRDKFVAFRENPLYSAFVDTVKRYSGSTVVVPPADLVASVFDERDPQDKATPSPTATSHDLKSKVDTKKAQLSKVEDEAEKRPPHAAAGVKLDGPVVSPRRVVGVWDDHDMGKNNGGAEFEDRDQNQQLFLDFLDTPELSPRRARKGLYSVSGVPFRGSFRDSSPSNSASKSAQPTGTPSTSKSAQSMEAALSSAYDFAVCNVLLDVRYYADLETDLLGEPQWAWLDEVITGGPALDAELGLDQKHRPQQQSRRRSLSDRCLFTMIGTGIQVISDEKPTEHWGQYPGARQRLLSLLRKRNMERFVFISGDVHMGEVQTVAPFFEQFREKPPQWGAGPLKIPVIDVTSSGMTHSVSSIPFLSIAGLENIFPSVRVRAHYLKKNFGTVTLTAKCLSKPRKGQSATKEHSDRSTSLEQVEVTAALCVHRVEDGAAVIRYDVDIFNDLSLTEVDKSHQPYSPVAVDDRRESTPHWQRPSASKEALEKEFRACPYKCDLSTVPLPPIRQLFVTIHRSLPFKVQLPTVIYGTVATTVVLCMCVVGFVVRRCYRALFGTPARAASMSPKAKEE